MFFTLQSAAVLRMTQVVRRAGKGRGVPGFGTHAGGQTYSRAGVDSEPDVSMSNGATTRPCEGRSGPPASAPPAPWVRRGARPRPARGRSRPPPSSPVREARPVRAWGSRARRTPAGAGLDGRGPDRSGGTVAGRPVTWRSSKGEGGQPLFCFIELRFSFLEWSQVSAKWHRSPGRGP